MLFYLSFVDFLWHIVIGKGIEVDPKKTDAVKSYPRLVTPSDITCFLSSSSYYERFIEVFTSRTSPMTYLTQKKAKFILSDTC